MKRLLFAFLILLSGSLLKAQEENLFTELTGTGIPQNDSTRLEVFDFDNNGSIDIIACDWSAGKLSVFSNDNSANFTLLNSLDIHYVNPEEIYIMAGDYDADTYTDMLVMFYASDQKEYIYVYKNNEGHNFTEAFVWDSGMADGETITDRFVFMDVDKDNDLDIVSGDKIFVFNGSVFKEPKIIKNWPKLSFRNNKFYNPGNLGGVNLYYESIVSNDGTLYLMSVDEKSDSVLKFRYQIFERDYDIDDVIYLDADNDGTLDKIWIEYADHVIFKYYSSLYRKEIVVTEIVLDEDFENFSWFFCGFNFNNSFDLIYSVKKYDGVKTYLASSSSELTWDEISIHKVLENKEPLFTYSPSYNNDLRIVDLNNDNYTDAILSNHIYLANMIADPFEKTNKPTSLIAEYSETDNLFTFSWEENNPGFMRILRNEIKINKDYNRLANLISVQNTSNSARLPSKAYLNTPGYRYQTNVADTGWMYWSVRSINNTLHGSDWADIDSFYVKPVKILGPRTVCGKGVLAQYHIEHYYDNVDSIKWFCDGQIEALKNQNGFFDIRFQNATNYHLWAILYDNSLNVVDSLNLSVTVKMTPVLTLDYETVACQNEGVKIEFKGEADLSADFMWVFGNGVVQSGSGSGPYEVKWNTEGSHTFILIVQTEGCESVDSTYAIDILKLPETKSLCGVSVNSDNRAIPFWSAVSDESIDSVYIYRGTSQINNYVKIGAVDASVSQFTDETSDCTTQPYQYKISVFDNTCDYETPLSALHKTIHLMLNKGLNSTWNLLWTAYEGVDIGTYSIYRGSAQDNLFKIADVAGNVYSYTDHNPPLGDLYYAIVADNYANECNSGLKSVNLDQVEIRSNIQSTQVYDGLNYSGKDEMIHMTCYNNMLKIEMDLKEAYKIQIIDITGKVLYHDTQKGTSTYDLSAFNTGILLVQISGSGFTKTEKIIIN
ncbi:T9SS type A sorting domain-containing protein [Saccharicrinis sp. FJH62]|uniref:T9SS type A sorting domain-containing protein n=1 Tax=Saccharicrinis sp. FJH62 TaxID=3344657 RepID=UPI0035D46014